MSNLKRSVILSQPNHLFQKFWLSEYKDSIGEQLPIITALLYVIYRPIWLNVLNEKWDIFNTAAFIEWTKRSELDRLSDFDIELLNKISLLKDTQLWKEIIEIVISKSKTWTPKPIDFKDVIIKNFIK